MFWRFSIHAPSFFSSSYSSRVRSALPLATERTQEWRGGVDDEHIIVGQAVLECIENGCKRKRLACPRRSLDED